MGLESFLQLELQDREALSEGVIALSIGYWS